jgi:hypothetical protein
MVKVKIGKRTFYANYDSMGSLNIWDKKLAYSKGKEAKYYIQRTEGLPKTETAAIRLLESAGFFPKMKVKRRR